MKTIPTAILDRPVAGVNLRAPAAPRSSPTLRDQLDPAPTILAFLRHLG